MKRRHQRLWAAAALLCAAWALPLASGCGSDSGAPTLRVEGDTPLQADARTPGSDTESPADTGTSPSDTPSLSDADKPLCDGGECGRLPGDAFDSGDTPAVADAGDAPCDGGGCEDALADTADVGECGKPPEAWLDQVCTRFCDQIVKYDFESMFAPEAECPGMCHEVLAEHPDWLPNFLCVTMMEQHYFLGNCWWPKPLPEIPGCDAWCKEAVACGVNAAFQFPDDPCLCEAACTGLFTLTGEAAPPLVECATEKLADTCSLDDMVKCFSMPLNCKETCAQLEATCKDGTSLDPLYPDEEACIDACQDSNQGQVFGRQICLEINGCKSPDVCADLPEEPVPGCAELCTAYGALCPWAYPGDFLCQWLCTGTVEALPGPTDLAGAAACVAQFTECPGKPEAALFNCLVDGCTVMCHIAPEECGEESTWDAVFPTPEACDALCSGFTEFQAMTGGLCVYVGGCDKPAPCLNPPEQPADGCDSYCDALLALCPTHPFVNEGNCLQFCTAITLQVTVADPGGATECFEDLATCPELPEEALYHCIVDPPLPCQDACQGLDACGLVPEWACGLFCSQLEADSPDVFAAFTACVSQAGTCQEMKPCIGQ